MAQNWVYGGAAILGSGSASSPSSVTFQAFRPPRDGDLLVAAFNYDATSTLVMPSGWAHVTGSPATVAGAARYACVWKIASAEGSTFAFSQTGCSHIFVGLLARYENINAAPAPVSAVTTATSSTVTGPTVTSTVNDSLIVRLALSDGASSLAFASGTSRLLHGENGDLIRLVDSNQATAGATGTNVATANTSNHLAAFTVAFKQGASPTTHVVTGSGSFSIGTCAAISASYTGIPSSLGTGKGNPVRYFELGNVAWATANGASRNYYLEHNPELIVAPFVGATTFYYSLLPGVTATFTELLVV